MSLIFITPKVLPSGHSRYGLVDLASETFAFNSDINQLMSTPRSPFRHLQGAWELGDSLTMSDLINHPDVITFTRDSHPEYFL